MLLASIALLALAVLPARAEKRLAFVAGNDSYQHITALKKARNDAEALGKTLESLGFSVTRVLDQPRREFNRAFSAFLASVGKGDTAMFFYAGHGVEIDGKNYLLPTDIPNGAGQDKSFVESEALAVDDLLSKLKAREALLNLVILDACRNDPFVNSAARSIGSGRGLARISAPQGTFVMYSADVGEAALDRLGDSDDHPNSVFTRTLLPLMTEPGRDLVDTAREVRRRVRDLALTVRHQQTPAYYDAVLGDFFFTQGAAETGKKPEDKPQDKIAALPKADDVAIGRQADAADQGPPAARALIATGSEKDVIRLWDADKRALIGELEGEKIVISTLKITGGGRTLAVAGADGSLFSYAIPQFKKKNALYPGFRVTAIAEGSDGALIVGGQDGTMAAIDPSDFSVRWKKRNHTGIVSPILVSRDGKRAVTASQDGSIAETDLATGAVTGRVQSAPGKEITDIAYLSPAVVVAVHEDGAIAHVNISTGRVLASFKGNKGWISSVEALGGGQYVTAGVDGSLAFWEIGSDRPLKVLKAHSDVASGAKLLSGDSENLLVSAGFDGKLKLWNERADRLLADLSHGSAILHFDQVSASR
jgi:uncharacterized caspase-like protein